MNTRFNEVRDPRSQEEIMLAARRMRADFLRDLYLKLRATLSGGSDHRGPAALSPSAR